MEKRELMQQAEQPMALPTRADQREAEGRGQREALRKPEASDAQAGLAANETAQAFAQMAQALSGISNMMRATNERMTALEQEVRLLTKVTPMQAGEINTAMRARAVELCLMHRMKGCEKAVTAAIRREVRLMQGVQNVREVPRCEYAVVMQLVKLWDDYKTMKGIKAKAEARDAEKNKEE